MPVGWVLLDTPCSRTARVLPSNSQSTFQEYSLTDAWNSQPLLVFLLVKALIWVITESKHQKGMNPDKTKLVLRWSRWCKFYLQCLHSSWIGSRNLSAIKRVACGLTYLSSSQPNCPWVGQQKASFPCHGYLSPQNPFSLAVRHRTNTSAFTPQCYDFGASQLLTVNLKGRNDPCFSPVTLPACSEEEDGPSWRLRAVFLKSYCSRTKRCSVITGGLFPVLGVCSSATAPRCLHSVLVQSTVRRLHMTALTNAKGCQWSVTTKVLESPR